MRRTVSIVAGVAIAVAGVVLTVGPAGAATACPAGAVCLRELDGSILNKNIWYSYGSHNLSGVYGRKTVVNNQIGERHGVSLCLDRDGVRCGGFTYVKGDIGNPVDFTPINSIVVN